MTGERRSSIACLYANGTPCGTTWVIAPGVAITAWHCLERAENREPGSSRNLTAVFPDRSPVKLKAGKPHPKLDLVLLSSTDELPPPLPLVRRPLSEQPPGEKWWSCGYPVSFDETTWGGSVQDFKSHRKKGVSSIELQVNFVNVSGSDSKLGGLSGAPVFAHSQKHRAMAAVHRTPSNSFDQKQFATPLDAAFDNFLDKLPGIDLVAWQKTSLLKPKRIKKQSHRQTPLPVHLAPPPVPTWSAPTKWNFWVSYGRQVDLLELEAFISEATNSLEAGHVPAFHIKFPWLQRAKEFIQKNQFANANTKVRIEVAQARGFVTEEESHRLRVENCVQFLLTSSAREQNGWGFISHSGAVTICHAMFTGSYLTGDVSFELFNKKYNHSVRIRLSEEECRRLPNIGDKTGFALKDKLRIFTFGGEYLLDQPMFFQYEKALPAILAHFAFAEGKDPCSVIPEIRLSQWNVGLA